LLLPAASPVGAPPWPPNRPINKAEVLEKHRSGDATCFRYGDRGRCHHHRPGTDRRLAAPAAARRRPRLTTTPHILKAL